MKKTKRNNFLCFSQNNLNGACSYCFDFHFGPVGSAIIKSFVSTTRRINDCEVFLHNLGSLILRV